MLFRSNPIAPRKRVKNILGLINYKCFMETSTCVTEKCMKFLRIPMVGGRLSTPLGLLKARYLDGAWQMEGFFEGIATDVVGKPFDK